MSGYSGGSSDTANYESVCRGNTKHIEVVKIEFDSNKITFGTILKLFFSVAHDPTQVDRQGADIGPQYSSVIFCIWLIHHLLYNSERDPYVFFQMGMETFLSNKIFSYSY